LSLARSIRANWALIHNKGTNIGGAFPPANSKSHNLHCLAAAVSWLEVAKSFAAPPADEREELDEELIRSTSKTVF